VPQANPTDVRESGAPAREPNTAVPAAHPHNPDFADREAREAGEEQQLHVERESLYRDMRHQRPDCLSTKHFETALRVVDAGHSDQLHDGVERATYQMPPERFADAARPRRLTRSNDHVRRMWCDGGIEENGPVFGGY
jgi:hypothetical protein